MMADELVEDFDSKKYLADNIGFECDKKEIADIQIDSPIQEFYKDQTIFITGATGFLGTLLVEKLIRCCPQIRKLILLVRNRGSKSVQERVREYFCEDVFDQMKLANPNYHEKVDIVCGQLDVDNLGIAPNDVRLLTSQTTLIFHIAATVRFDEHIRKAYAINVKGTKALLSLAKTMPHLKSFVHVSTAYCNCDRRSIDEVFYPPTFTAEELSILINSSSDEEMAILNEHLIATKPNTYTLTKAAAEDLVREAVHELPICVFRPSIVFLTLQEPMPSWVKGLNSVLAFCLICGTGLARVALVDRSIIFNLVPADRTINAMAALAWYQTTVRCGHTYHKETSKKDMCKVPCQTKKIANETVCPATEDIKEVLCPDCPAKKDSKVFNYVAHNDNQVTLYDFMEVVQETADSSGESNPLFLWKRHTYYTRFIAVYYALFYVLHTIPALAFSLAEKLTSRKPVIMMYYRKIFYMTKTIGYFMLNDWTFGNANMRALVDAISQNDRKWFDASMANFRWEPVLVTVQRTLGVYTTKVALTKEDYQTRMIYIVWVDYFIWLIIKLSATYIILDFLAYKINALWYS